MRSGRVRRVHGHHRWSDYDRGDVARALAAADVRVKETYTTAENTNNPIGLFATVAGWNGDALTVHDTTQYPHAVRDSLALTFDIDPARDARGARPGARRLRRCPARRAGLRRVPDVTPCDATRPRSVA